MIKGKECYETLQSSCNKIFSDVNKIVESGKLKLDEENEVEVEMYLGGDYKVQYPCIEDFKVYLATTVYMLYLKN